MWFGFFFRYGKGGFFQEKLLWVLPGKRRYLLWVRRDLHRKMRGMPRKRDFWKEKEFAW